MANAKAKGKGFGEQLAEKAFDKATEKFLDPVLTYIGGVCSEFTGYMADFDEHVKQLRDSVLDLSATRTTLQSRVVRAELRSINMKESAKVREWYKKEELARADADKLQEKGDREDGRLCLGKWCIGRLFYGKDVVKCCKRLSDLREQGNDMKDEELLQQGAPDRDELLAGLRGKFRSLRDAILNIEELCKVVCRRFQVAKYSNAVIQDEHRIESWLKRMKSEVEEGKSCHAGESKHIERFQNQGYGSTGAVQNEAMEFIERISKLHLEGEGYLQILPSAVGLGASGSTEAPPPPQPEPLPLAEPPNEKSSLLFNHLLFNSF